MRSPIETTPLTTVSLLTGTGELLRRTWLPALLFSALVGIPVAVFSAFVNLRWLHSYVIGFWSLIATAMVIDLGAQALEGLEPLSVRGAIGIALRAWPRLVVTRLMASLPVLLGMLLLLVPGLFLLMDRALVYPLALRGEHEGSALVAESRRRMEGHRMPTFLAFCAWGASAFVVQIAAGVLAVAVLVAASGISLDDAHDQRIAVVRALASFEGVLLEVPLALMLVVLDAKLRPRAKAASDGREPAITGLGPSW